VLERVFAALLAVAVQLVDEVEQVCVVGIGALGHIRILVGAGPQASAW
jgi:hypothetical protein